ncbi:hypothetical protein TorRG33x02_330890, partial [Trema orientale]
DEVRNKAAQAILEVSNEYRPQCCMAGKALRKMSRQQEDAINFSRKDSQVLNFSHNKPLYVEALVNKLKFKRALVDNGLSVNIMPYQTFKVAGIPENRLVT